MKTALKRSIFKALELIQSTKEQLNIGKKEFNQQEFHLPEEIKNELLDFLSVKSSEIGFAVYDNKTRTTYYFKGDMPFKMASTVKVAIMMKMLKYVEKENRELSTEELNQIEKMITKSDNDATTAIWNLVGGEVAMNAFFFDLELKDTTAGQDGYWGLSETTAKDQVKLLSLLSSENKWFTKEQRSFALSMMKNVIHEQKWGVSAGNNTDSVSLKNGWVPKSWNNWRINSIGCIATETKDYTVAVYTVDNPTQNYGIQVVEKIAECFAKN